MWDTTSVPNGTYVLRVVASDAPSNPPGAALSGEADSTTFDVDNTPPAIRVTGVRREGTRTVMSFEVADDDSAVQRMDYSLDATKWRPIYPKDGICDSRVEQFELSLEGDAAGRGAAGDRRDGQRRDRAGGRRAEERQEVAHGAGEPGHEPRRIPRIAVRCAGSGSALVYATSALRGEPRSEFDVLPRGRGCICSSGIFPFTVRLA